MSTLSGIASKGEKGKSKFQSLDINNLYKGESLEPSQQKSTVPRCKYGMQSLGKVPSARRPPANLPSLKSESSGSEPAVSLVPTGSSGWGNKPGENQSPTPPQPSVTSSSNASQSCAQQVQTPSVTTAGAVLSTQSATLSTGHDQSTVPITHTTTGDKSWSSIMAGESAVHPPSFLAHQSPRFQQEFPKLSSGDGQNAQIGVKSASDTQYGPGPSLRPQTEGSWIQGGGRNQGSNSQAASLVQGPLPHHPSGVDPAGGRSTLGQHPVAGAGMGPGGPGLGIPTNGPPIHGPLHLPPGTSPQFRTMAAPFMYRSNFPAPPGAFPPNFQGGMGLPRQRFPSGYSSESRFMSRPVDGEEIITRPIIKEEELNHMDDIARDTSWARPDEIDYNEKIVFSDTEDSTLNDEGQTRREEKNERERENRESRESSENEKDRNRDDRDRLRERERDRDRRTDDRSEKRISESNSRNWQTHSYTRLNYTPPLRNQIAVQRDRENEEEIWKEKRRLQVEMVAVVTERAKQRKEEEEKRHEETKRAAAKKLQMLDERLGKSQSSDLKDREDVAATVVPLPNWADKNRQAETERVDRIRNNNEVIVDKTKHELLDFRQPAQSLAERGTGVSPLRSERENRSRLAVSGEDRLKRDYDEKDGIKASNFRQDRTRSDERERLGRASNEGSQGFNRHFQNNIPPRFLKQQAERNQSNASSNNNYMRSSGSPQPSLQASSNNNFDPHWIPAIHSSNSFISQSSVPSNGGTRLGPRRFNSDSSESNADKCRNDRDTEDWDSYDRYKSNRERNYGKQSANYFESEHNRRNGERRDLDSERCTEDAWERDVNRDKDSLSKEKDKEKQVDDCNKSDVGYEEDREWRRNKEHKSEERDASEHEDERDSGRKDDRREERRLDRPQRPDSRDSKASRESRHSRDSIRDEKHECDYKNGNVNRGFVSPLSETHFKEEKKKGSERKDDRDKKEQNSQRHTPGPPITREKLEASEKNDAKRNLTQLKRFSESKKTNEEKELWTNSGLKERTSNETWSEIPPEQEPQNTQILKQSLEEKNKMATSEKKELGKNATETCKVENQEKVGKNDVKEENEMRTDKSEEEKEKREKLNKNRSSRGRSDSSRGRQGWMVSVYRSSHGSRGDRRRRDSGRMPGRSRFSNREWNPASESEGSVDEISASTESGKEEKKTESGKANKSRSNFKKVDKEEKNKETKKNENPENKGNFQGSSNSRFDRKNDFIGAAREGFAPSGQPSRRGRGSVRMRGGTSHRMDGYGPPPAKSPFGHHEEKKGGVGGEKGNDVVGLNEKGDAEEEKGKQKSLSTSSNSISLRSSGGGSKNSQIPPRLQKKSDLEQRESNRNKSSRGPRHHPNKINPDQGDDAWETTSENSEEERKNENRSSRKNYGRRGHYGRVEGLLNSGSGPRSSRSSPRSNSSHKKFSGRDDQGSKSTNAGGSNERNLNSRTYNSPNSSKNDSTNKEELKANDGSLSGQTSNVETVKTVPEENHSELNRPTDCDDGRNKKKESKDMTKTERRGGREKDKERRNKSGIKDGGNHAQQLVLGTNIGGPQPLMSQVVPAPPSMAKNFERRSNLPPRLAKQRQNNRIQKQHSSELVDINKVSHPMNIFPLKVENGAPPHGNAWEKPLRAPSPSKSSLHMSGNSSEPMQSDNGSQRSSPHIPREAIDKSLLDGSSPPVNTIIFENTNFKSTPAEIVIKNQFNNQIKQQRLEKGERKISEAPEDVLGFSSGKNDIPVSSSERGDIKVSEPPMIYGKSEDTSDMKLDFQFETELSQLTDDKATKGMRDLARSIQQSNMSPSTADLNFKIASVKKVWESMHTVAEHAEDSNNVSTFSPNFSPDSTMDPSAYGKTVEGSVVVSDDGSEVVYSTVPQMQVNVNYTASKTDVSSTTSNVCKVKPQQQTVLSTGHSPIGHSGQSPLSHGGPISPPPYSTAQAGQFNYQQTNIGGTTAPFGGMSAIPSPPTVLYNSSTQLPAAYQTFQIDGAQVLSSQAARSQFSQFPPYGMSQGLSQTSAFNQQSVYLHQTAPPTAAPDLYQSSISQYRIQPTVGPFGQSQINSNPNTVLISSTANSLMSATVKPSTQPIGAIGTKGASPFQQNPLPSQHSQLFIPYDQVQLGVNQSYLPNSQIVQRGAPVQPSASSFYSGSGAQAGFYQGPGSTLTQQGPGAPQLHQATSYSLQGFNSQSSATPVGLQSFSSQIGAQQYRTPGSVAPTTYLKSAVTPHHPTTLNLAQKSSSASNQQDVLDSVFSSGSQIPSPKPRPSKQISQQQQAQASPTQQTNSKFGSYQGVTQSASSLQQSGTQRVSQTNINMQSVRSSGSSPRYPNPIQRPVSYQHGTNRCKPQQSRPASSVKPYFGSQDGNLKLEEANDLKSEDSSQINCESKVAESGAQSKSDRTEDDAPKD